MKYTFSSFEDNVIKIEINQNSLNIMHKNASFEKEGIDDSLLKFKYIANAIETMNNEE